jgi:hypothetical protein
MIVGRTVHTPNKRISELSGDLFYFLFDLLINRFRSFCCCGNVTKKYLVLEIILAVTYQQIEQMFRPAQSLDYVAGGRGMSTEIGGRDRFKFFKRPVVPTMEGGTQTAAATMPINTNRPIVHRSVQPRSQFLQSDNVGTEVGKKPRPPRTLEQLPGKPREAFLASTDQPLAQHESNSNTRTIECQTMFRESDTQTDPYTPDYFVEEGQQPEVLAIMELRYGEGLPAGAGEVHMIDRVQRRKRVEANLPQGSDPQAMNERLVALEALEKLEWEEREAHIKGLQDTRLNQMERALRKREEVREGQSIARVESVKDKKMDELQRKLQLLQEKRLTATRKLATRHANPTCEKEQPDIIQDHILYGPRAKAVRTNTLVEKMNTNNYDVRPTLLSFPEGVQELERSVVPKLETVKTRRLLPPEQPAVAALETHYQKRQALQVLDHLEYANGIIEASHEVKQKSSNIQDLYRATPRLQRPDTPTLTLQGDDEEEKEEAILLLQRLLRGRAVQNDFYEGKERCHGLIEELQSASNAKDAEYKWVPEQERELFRGRQEATAQSVVDGVQGDVLVGTLDYLFKELTRQQESRKIDHLRDLAEATRKSLEEKETQKRVEERALREKEEVQYAKLAKASNATVEGYLSQMLHSVATSTALESAIEEVVTKTASSTTKPPETELEEEDLVCSLLDNVVIPAACRNLGKHQKLQRRYGEAGAVSSVALWGVDAAMARQ